MPFRSRFIAFGVSFLGAWTLLAVTGVLDAMGVSIGEALTAIPAEIGGTILAVVAVLFVLDPFFQ